MHSPFFVLELAVGLGSAAYWLWTMYREAPPPPVKYLPPAPESPSDVIEVVYATAPARAEEPFDGLGGEEIPTAPFTVFRLPPVGRLSIRLRSAGAESSLYTGDDRFDAEFAVGGEPEQVVARLPKAARDLLCGLRRQWSSFSIEQRGAEIVARGRLEGEEREVWLKILNALVAAMRFPDLEQRLAEIARSNEPLGVRRRAIWALNDENALRGLLSETVVRTHVALKLRDPEAAAHIGKWDLHTALKEEPRGVDSLVAMGNEALLLYALEAELSEELLVLVLGALGRVGTVAAVEPLLTRAKADYGRVLTRAAERAIAEIQSRASGSPGMLSIPETPQILGALSEAVDAGRLAVAPDPKVGS